MAKHRVLLSVNVDSYATIEVEAINEVEASRIVEESFKKEGFNSQYWDMAHEWDTDFDNPNSIRVI